MPGKIDFICILRALLALVGAAIFTVQATGCGTEDDPEDPIPPDPRFVATWADLPSGTPNPTMELTIDEGADGTCSRTLHSRGHSYNPIGDTVTFDGIGFVRVTGAAGTVVGSWTASPGGLRGTLNLVFNSNASFSCTETWPNSNTLVRTGQFALDINNNLTTTVTEPGTFWTDEDHTQLAVFTTGTHEEWGFFWSGNTLAIFGETHFEVATGFGGISYATFPQNGDTRGVTFYTGGFITRFREHTEASALVYRDRQSYAFTEGLNVFRVSPRIFADYSFNLGDDQATLFYQRPFVERRCTVVANTLTLGTPTGNATFTRQGVGNGLAGTWTSGTTTYTFDGNTFEYVIEENAIEVERGKFTVSGASNDWVGFNARARWYKQP